MGREFCFGRIRVVGESKYVRRSRLCVRGYRGSEFDAVRFFCDFEERGERGEIFRERAGD